MELPLVLEDKDLIPHAPQILGRPRVLGRYLLDLDIDIVSGSSHSHPWRSRDAEDPAPRCAAAIAPTTGALPRQAANVAIVRAVAVDVRERGCEAHERPGGTRSSTGWCGGRGARRPWRPDDGGGGHRPRGSVDTQAATEISRAAGYARTHSVRDLPPRWL